MNSLDNASKGKKEMQYIDELWDDYSSKYNLLCDKLLEQKLDCKLLDDVVKAREKIGF